MIACSFKLITMSLSRNYVQFLAHNCDLIKNKNYV